MADRYQDERSRRTGPQRGYGRQAEQFQSDSDTERGSGQMGESWRDDDYAQQSGWESDDRYDRIRDAGRDYPLGGGTSRSERYGTRGYGPARYTPGGGRTFASFTGNDYGGADFSRGARAYRDERGFGSSSNSYDDGSWGSGNYGAGSWLGANHGEWRDRDFGGRGYSRGGNERGFFERAGDEIASWFGDEDATRRRRQDHRGHGPSGYTRTDERIQEDASERLTEDWAVDARKITVVVSNGEITLDGTVPSRDQKRRAEDCVQDLSGVKHVQNNLRVEQSSTWDRNNSGDATGGSANKTTTSR